MPHLLLLNQEEAVSDKFSLVCGGVSNFFGLDLIFKHHNQIHTDKMIRNSTDKYKNKYQHSLPKHTQSTAYLPTYSTNQLPSNKTLSYISRTPTTRKLEHLHAPSDFDTSLAMPSKLSELKLKKKPMFRGSPT